MTYWYHGIRLDIFLVVLTSIYFCAFPVPALDYIHLCNRCTTVM